MSDPTVISEAHWSLIGHEYLRASFGGCFEPGYEFPEREIRDATKALKHALAVSGYDIVRRAPPTHAAVQATTDPVGKPGEMR